jgi:hypothetical protein
MAGEGGPSWARTSDPLIMSEIKPRFSDYTGLYWSSLSFIYDFLSVQVFTDFHKTWLKTWRIIL